MLESGGVSQKVQCPRTKCAVAHWTVIIIHWRLVVHACIDGYSRLIVYLHCANNNFASTVLDPVSYTHLTLPTKLEV